MKKGTSMKHVTTSKQNLLAKPYGFCCDIKEDRPRPQSTQKIFMPPFLSSGKPNEGPDIKFRIHEEDASSSAIRSGQKGTQKSGQKGRRNSRHRGGIGNGQPGTRHNGHRERGGGYSNTNIFGESVGERMICRRCRGPLQWYLEDEIAVAREFMINRRIEDYNAEIDRNVKIAKKKEKNMKRRKVLKKKLSSEEKEDTNENEEKY